MSLVEATHNGATYQYQPVLSQIQITHPAIKETIALPWTRETAAVVKANWADVAPVLQEFFRRIGWFMGGVR